MDFSSAQARFEKLYPVLQALTGAENEAQTRLTCIDEILFGCLGWTKEDCQVEQRLGDEIADYILKISFPCVVVEAKRTGNAFQLPAGMLRRLVRVEYFAKNALPIYEAIKQAVSYAQSRGISLAVVTNGVQFVACLATRDDGVPPLEGNAIVFKSADDIKGSFLDFWNFFARPAVEQRRFKQLLVGKEKRPIPSKLSRHLQGYPGVQRRNSLQIDLQIVAEIVLEDLAKAEELNKEFLKICYCESGALSQYALVSKRILETRYNALFEASDDPAVTPVSSDEAEINVLAESLSKRPILLIGSVGAGKSSFINYFTEIVSPRLKDRSIIIKINLGNTATLALSLRELVLSEIDRQLLEDHKFDCTEAGVMKGIYRREVLRFERTLEGQQAKGDPEVYAAKLTAYLNAAALNKEDHLRRALDFLSKSHRKQIIIIIDNADQRNDVTQQEAFLIAQELSETWGLVVFVALRPETFHRSIRSGSLSGYHPKAFSIAPPRIDRVMDRRIEFGLMLARGEIPIDSLPAKMRVNFSSLGDFLHILKASFNANPDLVEALENLAGGNVRIALDMVRQFLGSGHVNSEKILEHFRRDGFYVIPKHEFIRAIMFGDSVFFDPTSSIFVNIFDIRNPNPRDHFVVPIILGLLCSKDRAEVIGDSWVYAAEIYAEIQGFGVEVDEFLGALNWSKERKLIDTDTDNVVTEDALQVFRCRINTRGAFHHKKVAGAFYYLDAVIVDTPILDPQILRHIGAGWSISERITKVAYFLRYLSSCWAHLRGAERLFDWPAFERAAYAEMDLISRKIPRAS